MGIFSRISAIFGRDDEDRLSVPPMDGVFKPNNLLETAERVLSMPGVDNLVVAEGQLHFASGRMVFRLDPGRAVAVPVVGFDRDVTMLAAAPSGRIAVATEGAGLSLIETNGNVRVLQSGGDGMACVTAGLFEDDDTLYLTVGSYRHAMSEWKHDLMSRGATGQVLRYRISTGALDVVRDGLAFPYGLARLPDNRFVIAESWRHRLLPLPIGGTGAGDTLLGDLPAYPARIIASTSGGFWLALFAPRRQLTELVLDDDDYRLEMMATIPPEAWIGPDFGGDGEGEQPLQAGSVRQMGIMKPWAPSRSYGLVLRLDRDMRPIASYHSRADGRMHGIASIAELDGSLYVASRGAGTILRLPGSPT